MTTQNTSIRGATSRRLRLLAVMSLLTLAGCANAQPFDYTPVDEIPPGPGLLSGEDGAFTIGFGGKADAESPPDNGAD